jgi:hypothetical protein
MIKNFYEDVMYFNNGSYNNGERLSASIKKVIYSEKGIKELCSSMRFLIMDTVTNIYDTVVKYAQYKNIDINTTTVHDVYSKLIEDICTTRDIEMRLFNNSALEKLISTIKMFIKRCDSMIEFIQYTYRIESQTDERFPKMSLEDMLNRYRTDYYSLEYPEENDGLICENKLSQDFGKIACKRLRAMKADILSATNKYLGKKSRFAEFNIMDIIV